MPIEVELKAQVADRRRLLAILDRHATGVSSTYRDCYFDTTDEALAGDGKELRVRVIEQGDNRRVLATFKGVKLDSTAQPEHETTVGDADAITAILTGLGYLPVLAFEKRCVNYMVPHQDRITTVTVVQVPELGDETFVEIETLVNDDEDRAAASTTVRSVLADVLGLDFTAVTDELYTDAVRQHRAG